MIPVSTLYDEYIDRPKLTEQKKPVEYIVPPPPQEGSEQKTQQNFIFIPIFVYFTYIKIYL